MAPRCHWLRGLVAQMKMRAAPGQLPICFHRPGLCSVTAVCLQYHTHTLCAASIELFRSSLSSRVFALISTGGEMTEAGGSDPLILNIVGMGIGQPGIQADGRRLPGCLSLDVSGQGASDAG